MAAVYSPWSFSMSVPQRPQAFIETKMSPSAKVGTGTSDREALGPGAPGSLLRSTDFNQPASATL
jgi:hypothetical protein